MASNTSDTSKYIAICCMVASCISMLWIVYQCRYFVGNAAYQQHQAFKIRGKKMFQLTAFILALNFILRPILVAFAVLELITMSWLWRLIIDIAQMSLYSVIEFRCWMTYFNLNSSTAMVDRQWKKYLNESEETSDFFIKYKKYFGNSLFVGILSSFDGVLCVIICGLVEEYYAFYPDRIICHFFAANVLLFMLFIHRMYTLLFGIKHTYSHDMLSINKELNTITLIMAVTAICDCALGLWYHSMSSLFYVIYQTILISLLAIIIFKLPQYTITKLLQIEKKVKRTNLAKLKHVFTDSDLYHSLIRFMIQEWSAENLLFISQWMQLQQIIVDSQINVKVNPTYSSGQGPQSNLLTIPSDILLFSVNLLEASRGIYDKFVKTNDMLQVNISGVARQKLDGFFLKYKDIRRIFGKKQKNELDIETSNMELDQRTTVVVVENDSDKNENTNMVKYAMFIKQLKDKEIDINVIQDMIDSFNDSVKDCWENTINSFQRFQYTVNYKINSSHFMLTERKEADV